MDPDAVLAEMLREARAIEDERGGAGRLARYVLTLDIWLRSGGFLPADWDAGR